MFDGLKSILTDPPPAMAFEISEAGIAAARITSRAELEFQPLRPGTLSVSPLKENVADADAFAAAVLSLSGTQAARRKKDVALILPDYSARITVLDFDQFPADVKEQASLIRFRVKRSVPFDVESAAMSYFAQTSEKSRGEKGHVDVVVVIAPLEIVSRYEAPFRAAGMNPGLVTMSGLAALELAPEAGLSVVAKLTGRVLTVLVRDKQVLIPTFVYIEDNLGRRAEKLILCGLGSDTDSAAQALADELGVDAEPLRSPLGVPGENNAGLLGYLRSIARNN